MNIKEGQLQYLRFLSKEEEQIFKFDYLVQKISKKLNPRTTEGDVILIGHESNCFLVIKGEYNEREKLSDVHSILFKLEGRKDKMLSFHPSLYASSHGFDSDLGDILTDVLNYDEQDMEITIKLLNLYVKK